MTAQEKEVMTRATALKTKAVASCYRMARATKDWHTVIALIAAASGMCIVVVWDSVGGGIMLCAVQFFQAFTERALEVERVAEEVAKELQD